MPDLLGGSAEAPKIEQPSTEGYDQDAQAEVQAEQEQSQSEFLEQPEIASPDANLIQVLEKRTPTTSAAPAVAKTAAPVVKSEEAVQVEKILEDGLGPYYASLPESAKPKFRQKGEEASIEIGHMVATLQLNLKRILQLIRDWLLTIPNVNKFFLEQEAKIKTDKIVELVEEKKQDRETRP